MKCMFERRLGTVVYEHEFITEPRTLNNESLYATLIILSLLANKGIVYGVEQSGENELAYKQMEERFQIMMINYGTANRNSFLHIFEAILFLFMYSINNENSKPKRRNDPGLSKIRCYLNDIREEDIIEY